MLKTKIILLAFMLIQNIYAQSPFPLKFKNTSHFFVEQPGLHQRANFEFKNISSHALTALSFKTDCECITVRFPMKTIMPDSFGIIEVSYLPTTQMLKDANNLYIIHLWEDETYPPMVLRIKGLKDDDNDGVVNEEDDCPYEKGMLTSNGCPETEHKFKILTENGDTLILEESPLLNRAEVQSHIVYPKELIEAGIEGDVDMSILVDEKGFYVRHQVERGHPFLSEEIEKHLHLLRFFPLIYKEKETRYWVKIPFSFRLQ